ncbi:hypothetical protein AG1IA_05814 [Rhizoctonia solani AG-1 IA]|nr:hypothetical protein AG1IA_05814 [Rhizoctonia solani AG-1 IA]
MTDTSLRPENRSTSSPKDIFTPLKWSMKEIKNAVPPRLFIRNTTRSITYLVRDLILAAALWKAASFIDPYFTCLNEASLLRSSLLQGFRWLLWMT